MNGKSRAVTDQAASLSPTQPSLPNHISCVYATKNPLRGKKKTKYKHRQRMKKASEGEDNSRAKSYLAETKALQNC